MIYYLVTSSVISVFFTQNPPPPENDYYTEVFDTTWTPPEPLAVSDQNGEYKELPVSEEGSSGDNR